MIYVYIVFLYLIFCVSLFDSQGDFTSDDFVSMSAPLLYNMFKAKTAFPLHTAIRNKREDIVFLYLMEYDAQVRRWIKGQHMFGICN